MLPALSGMADFGRRFTRHRKGVIGFSLVALLVLISVLAPVISPYDPATDRDLRNRLAPPSAEHWFGTDDLGRDVFVRLLYGGRVSLRAALLAVSVAAALGTALGLAAGMLGGRVDMLLVWFIDVLLALPGILLAIAIVASLGPSLTNALLATSITAIPGYFRIVRSVVLGLREAEFIQASWALGASGTRVALKHVLPNSLPPLVVQFTLSIGGGILSLASLGFLGLGAQPPTPEWGLMIKSGYANFLTAPWLSIFPGLLVYLAVLGSNLAGDAVRDLLDPRTST